jgi:hypothetical protein
LIRKPTFTLLVILPLALIAEFFVLEGTVGISLPGDRGSTVSSYEILEKGTELHFITRKQRFTIVDLWSKHVSQLESLVLREPFDIDRQDGTEGANSRVKVEALAGTR